MGFVEAVKTGLSRSFDLSGRASRSEFWPFAIFLMCFAFTIVFAAADQIIMQPEIFATISLIIALSSPMWSAAIRRLHDTSQSGRPVFWLFGILFVGALFFAATSRCDAFPTCSSSILGMVSGLFVLIGPAFLIFILGPIALVIFSLSLCTRPSTPGTYTYGPNPHEVPS